LKALPINCQGGLGVRPLIWPRIVFTRMVFQRGHVALLFLFLFQKKLMSAEC
jgi:hypothetical protein